MISPIRRVGRRLQCRGRGRAGRGRRRGAGPRASPETRGSSSGMVEAEEPPERVVGEELEGRARRSAAAAASAPQAPVSTACTLAAPPPGRPLGDGGPRRAAAVVAPGAGPPSPARPRALEGAGREGPQRRVPEERRGAREGLGAERGQGSLELALRRSRSRRGAGRSARARGRPRRRRRLRPARAPRRRSPRSA